MGNPWFSFFDVRMASGITTSGQLTIKWAEKALNQYLNSVLNTNKDYVIAIDTDSVVGDTIISVNGKDITIADYYDSCDEKYIKKDDFNHNYVKEASTSDITPSVNTDGKLENKKIKYVMKHKVKKKLYKISVGQDSVVVTEDHSVIVKDKATGKISSVKPADISSKKHQVIKIT